MLWPKFRKNDDKNGLIFLGPKKTVENQLLLLISISPPLLLLGGKRKNNQFVVHL